MRRRGPLLLVLVALLLTLGGVAGTASPEPELFCPICPGADDGSIHPDHVGATTVDIYVDEDGHAEWQSVTEITNASVAQRWREEPPTFSGIGRAGPVSEPYDEPTVVITDEDELVVTFVDREAVRSTPGGTMAATYFHRLGAYVPSYIVTADRITVHAPEGYTITNDPAGATRDGDRATWETVGEDTLVVFAPAEVSAQGVRTSVAEAVVLAPLVVDNLLRLLVPTMLFGTFLGLLALPVRDLRSSEPSALAVGGSAAVTLGVLYVALFALDWRALLEGPARWLLIGLLVVLPLFGVALVRLEGLNVTAAVLGVLSLVALLLASQIEFTGSNLATPDVTYFITAIYCAVLAVPLVVTGAVLDRWLTSRGNVPVG